MIVNRQKAVAVNLPAVRAGVRRLCETLNLQGTNFTVCFVSDREIARLNSTHRAKTGPTDVLSFPWRNMGRNAAKLGRSPAEFRGYLGDIVISLETARRNARAEGHSTRTEIDWLILHGLLHLLGHDHETDRGEMTALELTLRNRLGRAGRHVRGVRGVRARAIQPGAAFR